MTYIITFLISVAVVAFILNIISIFAIIFSDGLPSLLYLVIFDITYFILKMSFVLLGITAIFIVFMYFL